MNSLSLFSGIGGLDLASEWAGFSTVAFCENNKYCQQVLSKHWPEVPIYDDIKGVTAISLVARGIDPSSIGLVHGGFPCQPFSHAGKRGGAGDDRYLWPEMLRVIREVRPTWFCGENVSGIISMALDRVCLDLEAEGYEVQPIVFPACGVGAPHKRERVFILAHSDREGLERRGRNEERPRQRAAWKGIPKTYWSEPYPGVRGVVAGLPPKLDRNNRLKALGNSVSPIQAYPVFKAIAEYEKSL